MTIPTDIEQLPHAELIALIRALIADNAALREENAHLRAEIERLKRDAHRQAAPYSKGQPKADPKPPGRKPGQGAFRYRSAPPEESFSAPPLEVLVTETVCPQCGGPLRAVGQELVTTTELPPLPQPEVRAYGVQICACQRCGRRLRGQHPDVRPDQRGATAHRLGPRAQAAAHLLPYGVGVPVRKVPAVLQMLTGLQVTQSALTQAALRAGNEAGPVAYRYAELRAEIKAQSVVNTDDTGWRLGGRRAQLMTFESEPVRVYQIRPQHRNDEVREVIGDDYQGILGTDRGKSYEARELLSVKQQKCLAHIQRLLSEALAGKRGMARFFGEVLQSQLTEAMDLHRQVHDPEKRLPDDDRRVRALEAEVSHHLRPPQLRDSDNQRLLNELGRHHERGNLLRFVHEPEVAPTNNAAERALRPAVIARKVSHCSKNGRGAQAFSALTSVIRTMIKSGATHVLESLTRLLDPSPPPETAS